MPDRQPVAALVRREQVVLGPGQLHVVVVVAIHAKKPLFARVFRFCLQVFPQVRNGGLFGTAQTRTDAVSSPCFRLHQVAPRPVPTFADDRRPVPVPTFADADGRPVRSSGSVVRFGSAGDQHQAQRTPASYQEATRRPRTVVRPVPVARLVNQSVTGFLAGTSSLRSLADAVMGDPGRSQTDADAGLLPPRSGSAGRC